MPAPTASTLIALKSSQRNRKACRQEKTSLCFSPFLYERAEKLIVQVILTPAKQPKKRALSTILALSIIEAS